MARIRVLLLPALIALVAACSSSPSPSGTPSSPAPTPSPVSSPVATPAPSGSPVGSPVATPVPSASPSDTPAPSMTAEEAALIKYLRSDAGVSCVPRRSDLPQFALRGIECRPSNPLVARIGVYWFASDKEAATSYLNRLAEAGVDVNSGSCLDDTPGEAAYYPGDGEGNIEDPDVFNYENSALVTQRNGCFRDENGTANVRLVCGQAYIGVLGTGSDLSDLMNEAWRYPAGYEVGTPDLPGLCIGEAVGFHPAS